MTVNVSVCHCYDPAVTNSAAFLRRRQIDIEEELFAVQRDVAPRQQKASHLRSTVKPRINVGALVIWEMVDF